MTSNPSYPALLDALRDISSTEQTTRTHDRERRKRELMDGVREDLFGRFREVGWSALEEEAPSEVQEARRRRDGAAQEGRRSGIPLSSVMIGTTRPQTKQ